MPDEPRRMIVAILPCTDIEASTRFYGRLGLDVQSDHGRYRILGDGNGWHLHLSSEVPDGWVVPGRNPNGLYLYLDDVDRLAAELGDLVLGNGPEHKPWACTSLPCPTQTRHWSGLAGLVA
jgi:catechol 2,3-dioxygenase-like lactoylglutathione lyase family enzyme